MIDPAQIHLTLCPFSRTFGSGPTIPHCRGEACALWRFEKITTAHPLWRDAVRKRAEEVGDKPPFAKASAWVAENKEAIGIVPTKGFCGAGGEP